jgi:hypothetical protein
MIEVSVYLLLIVKIPAWMKKAPAQLFGQGLAFG